MKNSIVLGYPYEGAFYWLLSAKNWRNTSIKSSYEGGHPYYRTLYGKNPGEFVDETASLCVMYDKIILAPADCYMPDYQSYITGQEYYHPDLGVLSNWDWVQPVREIDALVKTVVNSIRKQNMLSNMSDSSLRQIVNGVIIHLKIAVEHNADIIGDSSYQRLCQHIKNELLTYKDVNVLDSTKTLTSDLKTVFSLSGIHFSLNSLDEFANLRASKTLKKYGESFRKSAENLPVSQDREKLLLKSMLDAINNEDIAKQVVGGLDVSAVTAGYLSLIPFIGTVAGVASLAATHGSNAIESAREQYKWWMFAPELSKKLTISRVEERYKELDK